MNREIPAFLLKTEQILTGAKTGSGTLKTAFIDRTIKKTASFIRNSINQYESSKNISGFQRISAQTILFFFIMYVVCIGLTHTIRGQLIFLAILFIMTLFSAANLINLYKKVFILSFLFGFMVMIPAALNVFTPGRMLFTLVRLQSEKTYLIYHLPAEIGITYEGLLIVLRMFLKVFNSLTLTFFILHVVSFSRLTKALRTIRVPAIFILIITLSYKFIFILAYTVEEMYMALKARWIGGFNQSETHRIIAGRMGFLFRKSWMRYEETYKAMVARGYNGEVKITGIEKITYKEIALLTLFTGIGITNCIL
jgi:cobalt/nickel transport system permease protein